ncbi:MAG TPA: OmpA family protein [Bacteroidia bacterium]|nr:OmpA family protein [Bacteroidia bacterium]
MLVQKILLTVGLIVSACSFSQNLIPNHSFELASDDSEIITSDNNFTCLDWESPSFGTPDYFKGSRIGLFNAGDNLFGNIDPFDGDSYVGFGSNMGGQYFFEYISTKLIQPLIKGESYCLTFYVSAANKVEHFTTNEIDFVFTKASIYESTSNRLKPLRFEKCVVDSGFFVSGCWARISACYVAEGEEKFLTIGIMNPNYKHFNLTSNKEKRFDGVYLFLDNLSLYNLNEVKECSCNKMSIIGQYDKAVSDAIPIKNISFRNNSSELLSDSYIELNKIAIYLSKNSKYKIKLIGHTDSLGNEKDNIKLSQSRAKAVSEYLIKMGVAGSRITYVGYGSKFPISTNSSESGRLMNRRVEMKLYK